MKLCVTDIFAKTIKAYKKQYVGINFILEYMGLQKKDNSMISFIYTRKIADKKQIPPCICRNSTMVYLLFKTIYFDETMTCTLF